MDEFQIVTPHELLFRIPEELQTDRIDVDEASLTVGSVDDVRRILHKTAVLLFAFAEAFVERCRSAGSGCIGIGKSENKFRASGCR